MSSYDNFTRYLQESKDGIDEKAIQLSVFIYKNDLLNMIYEVNSSTKKPIAKIVHIGSPSQVIDVLSHAVTMPLKQIEIDLEQTPVLRRVYSEKKSIYFRKVPELIAGLIPEVKYQQQIKMVLSQLGITDIAVVPILINGKKFQKEYMIAVLGPLNDDQKKFIKEVSQKFANFYNKQ